MFIKSCDKTLNVFILIWENEKMNLKIDYCQVRCEEVSKNADKISLTFKGQKLDHKVI